MKTPTAAIALVVAFACLSQARAQSIDPAIRSAQDALTDAQRQQVAAYVTAQAEKFGSADPAGVVDIRNDLCRILKDPKSKDPFRREFGEEFVRQFGKFAAANDLLRATNVFIVARSAPCADTVAFLEDRADPALQPDPALRVAASEQLRRAVQAAPLPGALAVSLAKRVSGFAATEGHWIAASHGISAIVEAIRTKGLNAGQTDDIAGFLATAVNSLAARALEPGKSDLGFALQRALLAVRDDLPDLPAATQKKFLDAIGGSVSKLAAMPEAAPAGYSGDDAQRAYESIRQTAGILNSRRTGKPKS
jgi:hypothetical protein